MLTFAMLQTSMSRKKFLLLYIPLWLVWMVFYAWAIIWLGFSIQVAVIDSVVSNVLLAAIGLGLENILRFYRPEKSKFLYIFVWALCISAIWTVIIKWGLSQLITNNPDYIAFVSKSLPIRFFIAFLITGCVTLIGWLMYTFEEQQENEKRKADAEKLAKEAELFKLRQQLNPHFLFNSLNSISSLTGTRPEEARRMIQQLADFLRGTLKNEDKTQVTLKEELHYLQLYLDIEKVRFGHRLNTITEHDENSPESKVPQMLLQPIVENAIKFGLYDTTGEVIIKITTKLEKDLLVITIQNPFDPETSQVRQGTGFGLSSIRRRLYLLYARKDLLETTTEGNIFTTTIKIPQHD